MLTKTYYDIVDENKASDDEALSDFNAIDPCIDGNRVCAED